MTPSPKEDDKTLLPSVDDSQAKPVGGEKEESRASEEVPQPAEPKPVPDFDYFGFYPYGYLY
jgi:hypothetical protein